MGDMGNLFGGSCIKGSDETEGNGTGVNSSNNVQDPVSHNQPTERSMPYQPPSGSNVGLSSNGQQDPHPANQPDGANGQQVADPLPVNQPDGANGQQDPHPVNQPDGANGQQDPHPANQPDGANGQQVADPHPANQPDGANGQQDPHPANQPDGANGQQVADPLPVNQPDGANGQQALQDLLSKDCVVDCLAINLDIDYKLLKNWRHLAEEMEAPQDIKDQCQCQTVHSPTLNVLERPDIQNKTIQELMNAAAKRKDVSNILKEKVPEEDRNKSIEDGLSRNPDLMDEIATKLDRQPSSCATKNWKDIGKSLGIDKDELDLIEKGGHNPAEKLLLYAYSSLPPAKTKAKEFRIIIMGFTKREDLHKLLVTLGITENDVRPLKDIIPPDSENMKIMTAALNRCPHGLKNWKNLAYSWDCDSVLFDYPPKQSPTKTLLEWVRDGVDHEFTVDQLLNILGDKIKRYDVKQKLEEVIEKNR